MSGRCSLPIVVGEPQKAGRRIEERDHLEPTTNQTIYVARQVVDSLTDQDPETGELRPWVATAREVAPDAKT